MRNSVGPSPSAEEQLILWSAGTAARRRTTAALAGELARMVDWSLMASTMRSRKLLPLLGPRLVELSGGEAGEDLIANVMQSLDAGRRQNAFLKMVSDRLLRMLTEAGIRCTPLKGPVLSEALYGDLGRRPSSDIDLLVAQEQLDDAVRIVRDLGYKAPTDRVDASGLPLLHLALTHEQNQLPRVELHWRIHWYERSFARDRLLPPQSDLSPTWQPSSIDDLTALLLYYARDGFIDLRHATDLGAWWDRVGFELERGALEQTIRSYPALERVLLTAASIAERTVGLEANWLAGGKIRLGRRGHIAANLANPHPHASEAQLYAEIGLVDGLLAPSGGLRAFIERQVSPPSEVLRENARRSEHGRVSSRLGYSVRVLARYALAMSRQLRIPMLSASKQ